MKKIILVLLGIFSSSISFAAEPLDIVVKSRFDRESSAVMVEKVREYLLQHQLGDPFQQRIGNVSVEFEQVMERLPPETQRWIADLQQVLPLRLFDSKYRLVVGDLGYSIERFDAELRPLRSTPERIEYVTLNNVYGLSLHANYIAFEVKLPDIEGEDPIVFEVVMTNPVFALDPAITAELNMGWSTALMPSELYLSLHTIDLLKTFEKLRQHPEHIKFSTEDLILPDVSIRIGNREIPFDHAKIKKFLKAKEEELKQGVLELMSTRLGGQLANVLAANQMEVHVPRRFAVEGRLNAGFHLHNIKIEDKSILRGEINGRFINDRGEPISARVRRSIDADAFEESMHAADDALVIKTGNVVISVSEHFLNQTVMAALDSGAIDLSNLGFAFGPEKLFVLAEKKGEAFSLYIDVIYKLSSGQRILVGKPELHFPVRLDIGLKIVKTEADPRLQITVLKVDTPEELLIHGLPQYGLVSNVNSVRFRKKVLDLIYAEINKFAGRQLADIELKEFKDTYLDRLNFSSDGLGRASAVLDLK